MRGVLSPALAAATLLVAGCGGSTASSSDAGSSPGGGSGGYGTTVYKRVPGSLLHLPLTNQSGKRVSLASWPGRTVLLVPFLTLCQDICPMTTGNLLQVSQALRAEHADSKVEIVELTVDPKRDTPARLAAYTKLTGGNWQLVTERASELRALARFFGFYYQKVPEERPAGIDWWTGKRLTYDVDHSDNYFVLDPMGAERVIQDAAPGFHGQLNPKLYRFLSALGRAHLSHVPQPEWTPRDALRALGVAVGRPL